MSQRIINKHKLSAIPAFKYGRIDLVLLGLVSLSYMLKYYTSFSFYPFTLGAVAFAFYLVSKSHTQGNDGGLVWTILMLLFYLADSMISGSNSFNHSIILFVGAVSYYYLGHYFAIKYPDDYSIYAIFFVLMFSLSFEHIIVTMRDIFEVGLVNPLRHLETVDDEHRRSVTQRVIDLSLFIGSISFITFSTKDHTLRRLKLFYILFGIIALLCSLHYVSRTGVAIFIISFVICVIFRWKILSFRTFLLVFITVGLWRVIQQTELFSVYASREVEGSSILDAGSRAPLWQWGWETILNNPWGLNSSKHNHFAHNMWLDFGVKGGIIVFVMMVFLTCANILKSFKIVARKYESNAFRFIVLLLSVCFFLAAFSEAIPDGNQVFFFTYFFWCGFINNIVHSRRKAKIPN